MRTNHPQIVQSSPPAIVSMGSQDGKLLSLQGSQQTANVKLPTATFNITLTQAPLPKIGFFENPMNLVPVAAATVAFIGVLATLWFGWKKMKTELAAAAVEAQKERDQSRQEASDDRAHNNLQAHKERITTARREVYLELIAEMTKAQFALAMLPTQDFEKLNVPNDFGGLITATSKIAILGEMQTVAMSRELLSEIQAVFFRALLLLVPINEHRDAAAKLEPSLTRHEANVERLHAKMKEFHFRKISSLESSNTADELKFERDKVAELATAIAIEKAAFSVEHRKYADAVMAELKKILQKVDEVICSIRAELNLDTSSELLFETSTKMQAAIEKSSKEMYAGLETYFGTESI